MTWPPEDVAGYLRLLVPTPATASPLCWIMVAVAAGYLVLFLRQRRRRDGLPGWRAAAFLLGVALTVLLTGTRLEALGRVLLSVLMLQQLTLMVVVPVLLILGAPGVLVRRALVRFRGGRAWVGVFRGRAMRVLLHPAVSIGLFLFAYYGLYLFGLVEVVLAVPQGDLVLEGFFLLAGLLFAVPIFSRGPLPRPVGHPERALDVFVEMALHAFFGVLLMVSRTPLVPQLAAASAAIGVDPLADQQVAGGIAWSYGEGPAVLTLLYVMERWFRAEKRRDRRADSRARQHESTQLDAYNDYLARLQRRDLDPAGVRPETTVRARTPPRTESGPDEH